MGTKKLTPEQNDRLRDIAREVIAARFGGNVTKAAAAIGVAQSYVSEFLAGNRGAGPSLINGIASVTGRSIDDLYGRPMPKTPTGHQLLGSRDDWPAARDEALEDAERVRLKRDDVERVAGVSLSQPPERLTKEFVIRMAEALLYAVPYERRA